jgi:pyruvoyl-dependent arginine decarboxylase (PvlArgDC)
MDTDAYTTGRCRHGVLYESNEECEKCIRAEIAKRLARKLAEMAIKKPKT